MDYLPKHVAIVPDGNRRWAKAKGKLVIEGHRYAAETTIPKLIDRLLLLNIEYFTFWALSTENLIGRSKQELNNLFGLIRLFFKNRLGEFKDKKIKLKVIGDLSKLPNDLQKEIMKIVDDTKEFKKMTLILGLNYGGRDEIMRALKKLEASNFKLQNISKENFQDFLDTKDIPDPDLIIRTGGERRLSGFMLWQSEYSELDFSDIYFPDFTAEELEKSITNYSQRQRRFGK